MIKGVRTEAWSPYGIHRSKRIARAGNYSMNPGQHPGMLHCAFTLCMPAESPSKSKLPKTSRRPVADHSATYSTWSSRLHGIEPDLWVILTPQVSSLQQRPN